MDIVKSESLHALTSSEIERQVDTAKKYPRNIKQALSEVLQYATMDRETAEACFYALPRDGKIIVGESVRLAEIFLMCWGNIRAASRIIANDGRIITAQGIVQDFQNNNAVSVEVHRRITNKHGQTYSEDMQIVTAMAASSIAFRNAIFKIIPEVIRKDIKQQIKAVILGQQADFASTKRDAINYFVQRGVKPVQILHVLGKTELTDIDSDDVFILRGIATAVIDKEITLNEAFSLKNIIAPSNKGLGKLHGALGNRDEEDENEGMSENVPQNNEPDTSDIITAKQDPDITVQDESERESHAPAESVIVNNGSDLFSADDTIQSAVPTNQKKQGRSRKKPS